LEIVSDLDVPDDKKVKALKMLNHTIAVTGHGQIHDIFNEVLPKVTEAEVVKTLVWKTAHYTFLNPLQFGAILAGGLEEDVQKLHEYSMNAGLAFQLTDDIIGTFGDEAKTGKSATDDLREGKMTLLVAHALEHATPEQAQTLRAIVGNPGLTPADHQKAKQILEDTGAVTFVRKLATKHAELAQMALAKTPPHWSAQHVEFLRELAMYVAGRKS
jgi:geranylgeranyl pyrophosphate synthase